MAEKHRKRKESKTIKNSQNGNENSQNGREDTIKIIEIKYRNKIEETLEMIIFGVFTKVKSKVKKHRMALIEKKCANINIAHAKHGLCCEKQNIGT